MGVLIRLFWRLDEIMHIKMARLGTLSVTGNRLLSSYSVPGMSFGLPMFISCKPLNNIWGHMNSLNLQRAPQQWAWGRRTSTWLHTHTYPFTPGCFFRADTNPCQRLHRLGHGIALRLNPGLSKLPCGFLCQHKALKSLCDDWILPMS